VREAGVIEDDHHDIGPTEAGRRSGQAGTESWYVRPIRPAKPGSVVTTVPRSPRAGLPELSVTAVHSRTLPSLDLPAEAKQLSLRLSTVTLTTWTSAPSTPLRRAPGDHRPGARWAHLDGQFHEVQRARRLRRGRPEISGRAADDRYAPVEVLAAIVPRSPTSATSSTATAPGTYGIVVYRRAVPSSRCSPGETSRTSSSTRRPAWPSRSSCAPCLPARCAGRATTRGSCASSPSRRARHRSRPWRAPCSRSKEPSSATTAVGLAADLVDRRCRRDRGRRHHGRALPGPHRSDRNLVGEASGD